MKVENRSIGWMGLHRGHKARPLEWIAEKAIFLVSTSAILMIFLIFVFIGQAAFPIIFGQMNSSLVQETIPPEEMGNLKPEELRNYLGLTQEEFEEKDRETLRLLMEIKVEMAAEVPDDKDAKVNTTSWRYLLLPYQWTGYNEPAYIWQPVSDIHKYNIIPLIVGSIKTTIVALLFAMPLSLAAAIYVSQLASARVRETVKPCIELLAGIPSVVLGFFALIVMASFLQGVFGYQSRLNSFVAGIALGSSKWQAAWQIVVPAALPGLFAAGVLGFGRAIGETMIVLMASGNASIMSWNLFDSTRTITATIAAELAETVFGGHHYRLLFTIGLLLFVVTFLANLTGELVIQRLRNRLEGRA